MRFVAAQFLCASLCAFVWVNRAAKFQPPAAYQPILRVHPMQNWFALSDLPMDEAPYDPASLRVRQAGSG